MKVHDNSDSIVSNALSVIETDDNNSNDRSIFRRLKGMKVRDEFLCPITYEVLRDPVIAYDGNTYEKIAIKKWFLSNNTSPLNGEVIEKILIPNINLKKLIQDLINEGGAGLYTTDTLDHSRLVEICPERVLTFKCLGPPESEWNMQSFSVARDGCIGGRKWQLDKSEIHRELILFKDSNVSRRHFEICMIKSGIFAIRDLGSIAGTFIKLPFGRRKELFPGMIILIGKHQFTVSSIDDGENIEHSNSSSSSDSNDNNMASNMNGSSHKIEYQHALESAEELVADLIAANIPAGRIRDRLQDLSQHLNVLTLEAKSNVNPHLLNTDIDSSGINKCGNGNFSYNSNSNSNSNGLDKTVKRCLLTCFAPIGSPLRGRNFIVGVTGIGIGRKPSNGISLFTTADEDDEQSKYVHIDSSVSAEHARIEVQDGRFFIYDGTSSKPSTNGTWIRLSGPQQESAPYQLTTGDEILVGGLVRFQVSEAMTVSEKVVEEKDYK